MAERSSRYFRRERTGDWYCRPRVWVEIDETEYAQMTKVTYVDPPAGWRYGFPKQLPSKPIDFRQWFIDNGYPEEDVELALKYSRYWERDLYEREDEQ